MNPYHIILNPENILIIGNHDNIGTTTITVNIIQYKIFRLRKSLPQTLAASKVIRSESGAPITTFILLEGGLFFCLGAATSLNSIRRTFFGWRSDCCCGRTIFVIRYCYVTVNYYNHNITCYECLYFHKKNSILR